MTSGILRFELTTARSGRTVLLFAGGFALASLVVAVVGLSAGGVLAVQGFARTSISLLQLVVWVVPLVALLSGAAAGAECREVEFVFALPVTRTDVLLSCWARDCCSGSGARESSSAPSPARRTGCATSR